MTPRVDAGPCLAQAAIEIGAEETAPELEVRLAELGAPLVCATIDRLERGDVQPIEQSAAAATGARRLRKTDGEVEWSRAAEQIRNQVRALEPWPRTSASWHKAGAAPLRLILGHARVSHDAPASVAPGTIVSAERGEIIVATGEGCLVIDRVQPAGKRMMSAAEFLRGHQVMAGDKLGPAEPPGTSPAGTP
jgi:methionyl-tRNA formyltransferase